MHPFLDHPRPIAIAHRGGSLEAEENTMPAFAHAVSLGYSHVETDVHATADGVAVIHHDATLERMTGDPRPIAALDWADLAQLRTHGGAAIPRLEELLASFPDLFVALEAKSATCVAPLAQAIRDAQALDRICIGSFEPGPTAQACAILGAGLCWSPAHAGVARLWAAGWGLPVGQLPFPCVQIPPRFRGIPLVTRRLTAAARARGVQVQVWTVNEDDQMAGFLDMGVDGLMTDRPTLLRDVMRRRGDWHAT